MDLLAMLQGAVVFDAEGDKLGRVAVITVANGKVELRIDQAIIFEDEDPDPDGGEEVDIEDMPRDEAREALFGGLKAVG